VIINSQKGDSSRQRPGDRKLRRGNEQVAQIGFKAIENRRERQAVLRQSKDRVRE